MGEFHIVWIIENCHFAQAHISQQIYLPHYNDFIKEHDGVSNYQPHDCLLDRLFRRRSQKTSKLRVTGISAGNSPATGEFPAQMASNAEIISIW